LSGVVSGGIGPFNYQWYGYRDDGTPFSYTFSDTTAAQPQVALVFPDADFYFFLVVTDTGLPLGNPGRTARGYIRVHESDDALAVFNVLGGPFQANVTDVLLDASASQRVLTPIGWNLEYIGNVPEPQDIEDYLTLQSNSNGTLFWDTVYSTTTDVFVLDVPASNIAQPGAYRMEIQVNGDLGTHQTYEYFWVRP